MPVLALWHDCDGHTYVHSHRTRYVPIMHAMLSAIKGNKLEVLEKTVQCRSERNKVWQKLWTEVWKLHNYKDLGKCWNNILVGKKSILGFLKNTAKQEGGEYGRKQYSTYIHTYIHTYIQLNIYKAPLHQDQSAGKSKTNGTINTTNYIWYKWVLRDFLNKYWEVVCTMISYVLLKHDNVWTLKALDTL